MTSTLFGCWWPLKILNLSTKTGFSFLQIGNYQEFIHSEDCWICPKLDYEL